MRIIIIGGGFGGLAAAQKLSKSKLNLEITLIDKKESLDFLPTLPDCIGRGIKPDYLAYKINRLAKKWNLRFIKEEVAGLDLDNREVSAGAQRLKYDYLIISSGSETNFYGNDAIKKFAYSLDSVEDAKKIRRALKEKEFDSLLVVGGGYTGIEVATNLRVYLDKIKSGKRITIIERAPSILGPLPEWMKNYVAENLIRLKIDLLVGSSIEDIGPDKVLVSAGRGFTNPLVIWAAGVKTSAFIQNLKVEKNPQGRIKTDDFLRLNASCFVVGDTAYFQRGNTFLRMAVQFAIFQGRLAALNIIRSIEGKELLKYKPLDLGYVIPMANNKSCGRVMGVNLTGFLPTCFHFIMCIYRSYGISNRVGIIKNLIMACLTGR